MRCVTVKQGKQPKKGLSKHTLYIAHCITVKAVFWYNMQNAAFGYVGMYEIIRKIKFHIVHKTFLTKVRFKNKTRRGNVLNKKL